MATDSMVSTAKRRIARPTLETAERNLNLYRQLRDGISPYALAESTGLTVRRIGQIMEQGEDHWSEMLRIAEERGIEQIGLTPDDDESVVMLPIDRLMPSPYQPRSYIDPDEVRRRALDIRERGLLQPIVVTPIEDGVRIVRDERTYSQGDYIIIFGHIRVESYRLLASGDLPVEDGDDRALKHWQRIPAIVRPYTGEADMALMALSENVQRAQLRWGEETRAMRTAIDTAGVTQRQLAAMMGISENEVSNRLRVLRLPDGFIDLIDNGNLSYALARDHLLQYTGRTHTHDIELQGILGILDEIKTRDGERRWRFTKSTLDIAKRSVWSNISAHQLNRWRLVKPDDNRKTIIIDSETYEEESKPAFDVEAFKSEVGREFIHRLPDAYGDMAEFTCKTELWDEWQSDAETALMKAEAEAGIGEPYYGPGIDYPCQVQSSGVHALHAEAPDYISRCIHCGDSFPTEAQKTENFSREKSELPSKLIARDGHGSNFGYAACACCRAFHRHNGLRCAEKEEQPDRYTCVPDHTGDIDAQMLVGEPGLSPTEVRKRRILMGSASGRFTMAYPHAAYLPTPLLDLLDDVKIDNYILSSTLTFVHAPDRPGYHADLLRNLAGHLTDVAYSTDGMMTHQMAGNATRQVIKDMPISERLRPLDDKLVALGFESPKFSVDRFVRDHASSLHRVHIANGEALMTCAVEEWDDAQRAAIKNLKALVARGNTQSDEQRQSAQLQDLSMAHIPQDEDGPINMREVSNCTAGLADRAVTHWHVEYPATRQRWLMQSLAFMRFEDAAAFRASLGRSDAWVVMHERETEVA